MTHEIARKLNEILTKEYNVDDYVRLMAELFPNFKKIAPDKFNKEYTNFSSHIEGSVHVGNVSTVDAKNLIIMAVQLKKANYVENSRSTQRSYAKKLIENANADAALIAFYTAGELKWRLSFVRLDYEMTIENGRLKTNENLTPAKRYSYLVGKDEPCHTVVERFEQLVAKGLDNPAYPTLDDLENAFSVEKVTDEFFKLYCEKFHQLREQLETNEDFCIESEQHSFTAEQFAKKLMGQIVFLYFLQKKGWLGVKAWPNTLSETDYKKAFFSKGQKSRTLIPQVYHIGIDGLYHVSSAGLNAITDEDEEVLATCVKGEPWGSGPHNFMRKLFELADKKQLNFYDDLLEPLFYDALNVNRGEQGYCPMLHCRIPFLSGGLFEPIDGYDWKYNNFNIPNEVFSNREEKGRDADGILDIFDRYNFTMSEDEPMEREVAIDPEMLGKVFENLLEVRDRKSKGAFYTPREIVHYMCQESLINYLTNTLNIEEDAIRDFILYGDFMKDEDTVKEKRLGMYISEQLFKLDKNGQIEVNLLIDLDEALKNVRVADPAVGSGAFPLGMLNEIVRARQNISAYMAINMTSTQRREMYQLMRSPHQLKYETIKNCIFAADIDPSAVDITQLRLWLSLVIDDEINPTAVDERFGHRNPSPLPNLECNILCGNSLIDEFEGIRLIKESDLFGEHKYQQDFEHTRYNAIVEKLIDAQNELFKCDNTERKRQLKDEIDNLRDMLIDGQLKDATEETKVHYQENKHQASKPFILWQLDFARVFREKGGFDIVIGNPPYVKIQNIKEAEAKVLKANYKTATGKFDIYVLFVEKLFKLINEFGIGCFIQPHRFLNAGYGKGLRDFLTDRKGLKRAISFGTNQVFNTATTYTGIFLYCDNNEEIEYAELELKNFFDLKFYPQKWRDLGKTWNFSCRVQDTILSKISSMNKSVLDIFKGIYQGVITPGDNIFILKGEIIENMFYGYSSELEQEVVIEAEIMKSLLKGENIKRYMQPKSDLYLIYPHIINEKGKTVPLEEDEFRYKYPKAYNYIYNFKEELIAKKIKYKTNPKYWYSLHRARKKSILDSRKIITPQLQNYSNFAYDFESKYPDAGGYMLIIKDEYRKDELYYYAILNSALFYHFIKSTSTAFNNYYYYFKTAYIEPFKFPDDVLEEIKMRIITNVETVLNMRKQNEDVTLLEQEIDKMVFSLYDLDETEISRIEKKY